jgi:signal transduction histidine kinase
MSGRGPRRRALAIDARSFGADHGLRGGPAEAHIILDSRDGHIGLIVEDDGRGFDVDAQLAAGGGVRHLGLLGMRERLDLVGGTLTIESGPGGPTTLLLRVPTTGGSR